MPTIAGRLIQELSTYEGVHVVGFIWALPLDVVMAWRALDERAYWRLVSALAGAWVAWAAEYGKLVHKDQAVLEIAAALGARAAAWPGVAPAYLTQFADRSFDGWAC